MDLLFLGKRQCRSAFLGRKPRRRAPDVRALLHRLADEYPEGSRAAPHADVARIAFQLSIVVREKGTGYNVCDSAAASGCSPSVPRPSAWKPFWSMISGNR